MNLWNNHSDVNLQLQLDELGDGNVFDLPVNDAEKQINSTEDQQLLVEQLIDAALPPEQEFGEAPEPHVGHLQAVWHRHGSCRTPETDCDLDGSPCLMGVLSSD